MSAGAVLPVHFLLQSALLQDLVFVLCNAASAALLLVAHRRGGPAATLWRWLAGSQAVLLLGNISYAVQAHVLDAPIFVAPSDLFFALGSVIALQGVLRVAAPSTADRGSRVLDGLMVTTGLGLLVWLFLAEPFLRRGAGVLELLVLLVQPTVTLFLALSVLRLVRLRRADGALHLVALGLCCSFLSVTWWSWLAARGAYASGSAVDALFLASFLLPAVATLLPSARSIGEAASAPVPPSTLAFIASCLGVVVLLHSVLIRHDDSVGVQVSAAATLALLAIIRAARALRASERALAKAAELEATLQHRLHHDPLTGLANREKLAHDVRRLVLDAERTGGSAAALYVDLDGFKQINDALGHAVGDRLLVQVADRLRTQVEAGDTLARLAGDEFVLLTRVAPGAVDDAQARAGRLRATLDEPVVLDGRRVHVPGSVGVAVSRPGEGVEQLLHRADLDMYRHKAASRPVPAAAGLPAPRGTAELAGSR